MSTAWATISLLFICAGHAELWITLLNRSFGVILSTSVLRRLRRLHDTAIVLFPVAVVGQAGWRTPAMFFQGEWSGLSPFWIAIYLACSLGLGGLMLSILTWWIRTRRCMRLGETSVRIALPRPSAADRSDFNSPPTRRERRHAWLAKMPGNQQFSLEVTEKTLSPPGWPESLDGLSILHLSDWHLSRVYPRSFFETAAAAAAGVRADLVVLTGDLLDDLTCLDWLPATLGRLTAPLGRWFILGNHDSWHDPSAIRRAMCGLGWCDLGGRAQILETGHGDLLIAGDETPWLGERPNLSVLREGRPGILLSHSPDCFPWAAGLVAHMDVILAGHNHGGQVVLPLVGPVYSPSVYGCRYPAGVFAYGQSVMHVSRGLAGEHPLRFGSRPEITRLSLRSRRALAPRRNRAAHAPRSCIPMASGGG